MHVLLMALFVLGDPIANHVIGPHSAGAPLSDEGKELVVSRGSEESERSVGHAVVPARQVPVDARSSSYDQARDAIVHRIREGVLAHPLLARLSGRVISPGPFGPYTPLPIPMVCGVRAGFFVLKKAWPHQRKGFF